MRDTHGRSDQSANPRRSKHRPSTLNFSAAPASQVGRVVPRFCYRLTGAAVFFEFTAAAQSSLPSAGAGSEVASAWWLWQAVIVGGIVLNIVVGAYSIAASRRAGRLSQHREVSFSKEYVDRSEWHESKDDIEARMARIEQVVSELADEFRAERQVQSASIEQKLSRVHERIDALKTDVANLPSQIIATLVNARLLNKPDGGEK